MTVKEILDTLKIAANFELKKSEDGRIDGFGAINRCPQCKNMTQYDYSYEHYPKMKNLLESLPWEKVIDSPRFPKPGDYPTEDGEYITMMDANEHEVCTNTFKDGNFVWMNRTHIKWWMKLPKIEL